jgi:hypothetical protein
MKRPVSRQAKNKIVMETLLEFIIALLQVERALFLYTDKTSPLSSSAYSAQPGS